MILTRRQFLKLTGATGAALASLPLYGCAGHKAGPMGDGVEAARNVLDPKVYREWMKGGSKVFGPGLESNPLYGGTSNFDGHRRAGHGAGTDYRANYQTPLVPCAAGTVAGPFYHNAGGEYVVVNHEERSRDVGRIITGYYHLSQVLVPYPEFTVDQSSWERGTPYKWFRRDEVIALSGASGNARTPHLHLDCAKRSLFNVSLTDYVLLDIETLGIDKGPLTYWDGKTFLDYQPRQRFSLLKNTVKKYENTDIPGWGKSHAQQELAGRLAEYAERLSGKDGTEILSSSVFADMRNCIKNAVYKTEDYGPETPQYTAMLEILGHGKDPTQDIIFTLPFVPPGLEHLYKIDLKPEGLYRKRGRIFLYNGQPIDELKAEYLR
jgi:hypothetical protein